MGTANQLPTPRSEDQREALEQAQEDATATEPQNFRNEANADKVVEIPADKQNAPIQGIDPADRGSKSR